MYVRKINESASLVGTNQYLNVLGRHTRVWEFDFMYHQSRGQSKWIRIVAMHYSRIVIEVHLHRNICNVVLVTVETKRNFVDHERTVQPKFQIVCETLGNVEPTS